MTDPRPNVAIVDYGMGNLFSVQAACAAVGLSAAITESSSDVDAADAVILPGVGAFGEAMSRLSERSLDAALGRAAASGKPFFAICLGMQLLFEESEEFGSSRGLALLPGRVVRLPASDASGSTFKVPAIGWNTARRRSGAARCRWSEAPLAGVAVDEHFYFVHSYFVQPADPRLVMTTTCYAGIEYPSSVGRDNIFACQFHPERSGVAGLQLYRNFAASIPRGQ